MNKARNLAKNLEAELEVIEDGGHLNQNSGFTKFPELLEEIEKWMESEKSGEDADNQ